MTTMSSLTQQGWLTRRRPVVPSLSVGSSETCLDHGCSPRVLVVDDCKDTADSLEMVIEMWGYDVEVAYDGETAIETALIYHPDAIFLDIGMPRMDGCEAVKRLRKEASVKDALMVAVSGYHDDLHKKQAMEAGFDLYHVKPVDPAVMKALLVQRERGRRAAQSLAVPTGDDLNYCVPCF
jgi:CheY-like chemotaxis protein